MEELITYLDVTVNGFANQWSGSSELLRNFYDIKRQFIEYLVFRLSYKPVGGKTHSDTFIKLLCGRNREDDIISLNYDLIVEKTIHSEAAGGKLQEIDILEGLLQQSSFYGATPVTIKLQEREVGSLIKLHGSLNWISCSNLICPNHNYMDFNGTK